MPAPENNQNAVKDQADKASSFLYVRATPTDKASWVRASNRSKTKLSKWVTEKLNQAAEKVLSEPDAPEVRKGQPRIAVPKRGFVDS